MTLIPLATDVLDMLVENYVATKLREMSPDAAFGAAQEVAASARVEAYKELLRRATGLLTNEQCVRLVDICRNHPIGKR